MTASIKYRTPPQYGESIGVDPAKVITWIKSGELRAINVATNTSGRPRFRIPLEAIVEFEEKRSARPPAKSARKKRVKKDDDFVRYFS